MSQQSIKANDATSAWSHYYQGLGGSNNFYPENFVTRIFLSSKPVSFLDKNYSGKKILDFGCGHGRNIPFLLNLGFDVTGLEVGGAIVDNLNKGFPEQNFLTAQDNGLIAANDESFDYVLACNSIYYSKPDTDDFRRNIDEVIRVLKPGGYLVFSMLGLDHSIFDGYKRQGQNAVITKDFLGFRENTAIRPLWDISELKDIVSPAKLLKHGKILEQCEGFNRHMHYIVAQK